MTKWISVSKEYPPEYKSVLVVVKQPGQYLVSADHWNGESWHRWHEGNSIITHWAYLPSPPEDLLK